MKKTTLKIKDISTITMKDEINIIETVAGFYFRDIEDDYGNIHTEYTPYLSKVGKIISAAENFIYGFAETFNADYMMDAIIKRYSESDLHKRNQEIVEANKKIREMDNKIIEMKNNLLKEKQKDSVRNVISDKKKEE